MVLHSPVPHYPKTSGKEYAMVVYGALDTILLLIGLFFAAAGFLDVTGITDIGLDLVSVTQIHQLPILSSLGEGWVYLIIGVLLMGAAGAIYNRRVIDLN